MKKESGEIMGGLYCIPMLGQLRDYVAFSEKYRAGFEYNEFFMPDILDDEVVKNRIISEYLNTGRDCSEDTLHGAFLDVCVNSADSRIFQVSDLRVRQSMDIAVKMGLSAVIFHTNYIVNFRLRSYIDSWISLNEEYWRRILKDYPEQKIYIENMFDDSPELLTELAKRMADEPRFAVCLDTAHAMISGSPLEPWLMQLKPYIEHIHINDNDGLEDLHQPVGCGCFKWDVFNNWIRSFDEKPSILIEVRKFEELQSSAEYMEQNGIYPF